MVKKFVEFGTLLGEKFMVAEETAQDPMFGFETQNLCDILTGAQIAVDMGEQLTLAIEFFTDFKLDLIRGEMLEWFAPESVANISKAADTIIYKAQAQLN